MKPNELRIYDAYPQLITDLIQMAAAMSRYPLEEMAVAAQKVALTGAHIGVRTTLPVDTDDVRWQAKVIAAAIVFRDTCTAPDKEPR